MSIVPTILYQARRALLRVPPEISLDFIRIMAEYGGCRREDAEELLRTKAIRELLGQNPRETARISPPSVPM